MHETDLLSDYFSRIGKKGGHARAKKLTPEQRRESAQKAAKASAVKRSAKAKAKKSPTKTPTKRQP